MFFIAIDMMGNDFDRLSDDDKIETIQCELILASEALRIAMTPTNGEIFFILCLFNFII
jgi:hypothetical protein